jgi:parvulin-like peptidyl-prolyl isomerase
MKSLVLVLLAGGVVWAQTAPPATQPLVLPANVPDTAVIAVISDDSVQFTAGDLRKLYPVLPPPLQQAVNKDTKEFFHEWAMVRHMAKLAEKRGLDKQEPYAAAIESARLLTLFQAELDGAYRNAEVQPADIVNYYGAHKADYQQIKVQAIYLPFADAKEEEVKAKAYRVATEIRGGADFAKMVQQYSEDETSKAKGGEFATLRANDRQSLPEVVQKAVFALKQGEISDPVRQAHGYYIFKAAEVGFRPLSEVRDEIFTALKQSEGRDWYNRVSEETKVEFPNPAYPGTGSK